MWLSAVELGNAIPIRETGSSEFLPYTRQDAAKLRVSFAAFVPFARPDLPGNRTNSRHIPDRVRPDFSSD